jgi:hypothetical protein
MLMTTLFLVARERGERAERILAGMQRESGLRVRRPPDAWDTAALQRDLPRPEARDDIATQLDAVDPAWRDVVALI